MSRTSAVIWFKHWNVETVDVGEAFRSWTQRYGFSVLSLCLNGVLVSRVRAEVVAVIYEVCFSSLSVIKICMLSTFLSHHMQCMRQTVGFACRCTFFSACYTRLLEFTGDLKQSAKRQITPIVTE
jgi:hypothetical protein